MSTPLSAPALAAAIPEAVHSCSTWLRAQLAPLMHAYCSEDAIALLAKSTTGDSYSFLVSASPAGIHCGSRIAIASRTPDAHIWLGFARVEGDRRAFTIVDPHPFQGWGEHAGIIADVMRAASIEF